jgi:hypothetical protein
MLRRRVRRDVREGSEEKRASLNSDDRRLLERLRYDREEKT